MWGADERRKQILANPGSAQVVVPGAKHFFEDREDELVRVVAAFLDRVFGAKR
jgi:alpha/beta superfamily hydrolase